MSASIAQAVARYAEHAGPPVARAVRDAAAKVPALAARLADAGLDPRGLTHADLARLPVLAKDEVIALQRQRPLGWSVGAARLRGSGVPIPGAAV